MPLPEIKLSGQRSIADEIYAELRASILNGTLLPSERLVEQTIADLGSFSRTPVREALRRLQTEGLVRETSRGLVVSDFSLQDLSDICAVRETLEGLAARLAASGPSELELARLTAIVNNDEYIAVHHHDIEQSIEFNHTFHETIWNASRNRYLMGELHILRSLLERVQESTLHHEGRLEEALEEHRTILKAIAERDSNLAEQAAREHFRKAMMIRLAAWTRLQT